MAFQFIIPQQNRDLLDSNGNNYFVKQVCAAGELADLLKDAKNSLNSSDAFYIFDHFDTFFSLIENAGSVSMQLLMRGCDLLYITVDKLGKMLTMFLQTDLSANSETDSYLNLTKMVIFLCTGLTKSTDQVMAGDTVGNKKNAKKPANDSADVYDWENKRYRTLVQMFNFMQLPLEKLWSLNVAEEEFVNMICDLGYRTLEHYSIKQKRTGDTVFQILGLAIKRYNHALTFPVKILQILRTCDIALAPTANGVNLLYEEYGITTIFAVLLKEIVDTLSVDAADSTTSKNFSLFLTELGTLAPKLLIPHLSTLGEELLNLESYILRNCVLQIMGDVVTVELTSEELTEELKESRNYFLEDLFNHMLDVSAHVRSKVLQIWTHMQNENAVPLVWQHKVLENASDRLEDKSNLVRKNALLLIKSFLETNPYAPKLSLNELTQQFEKEVEKIDALREKMLIEEKKLTELDAAWDQLEPELMLVIGESLAQSTVEHIEPVGSYDDIVKSIKESLKLKDFRQSVSLVKSADFMAGNLEERKSLTYDQQCGYYAALLKSYWVIEVKDMSEEYQTMDQTIKFLTDSIAFAKIIATAVPKIELMLMSKTNTDVYEAADFFTTAYLFGIRGTETGLQKMLYLVWSGDKDKKEVVTKSYHRVLFVTDQQGKSHHVRVVDNLCKFLENINVGHYQAMEVLMQDWVTNGDISVEILQVMFERFTQKLPDTTDNHSRLALQLLIMASMTKPSIVSANTELIQTIGFGERGLKDARIFASCLNLLMNSTPQNSTAYYKRLERANPLIEKSVETFKKIFFFPNILNFDNVSSKTLDFIYQISQEPDLVSHSVLVDICYKLREISAKAIERQSQVPIPSSQDELPITQPMPMSQSSTQNNNRTMTLPDYLITRIIYLIGYMAMRELTFLDVDVYNNLNYRQDLLEQLKDTKNRKKKVANMNMSASDALKRLSGSAVEPQEADEDLVGATAEDSSAELINLICETEFFYSKKSILKKFTPIIMEILKYPAKYRDKHMQQAACCSLIRLMSVSSKFCEQNMPFLMNILSATKNIHVKCNIVVGLSDFTFRFPNVIEPWTSHFYSLLHDTDDELRLTAVKILSYLIMHEMIRVKGQISDLALCIVDANDEIRNITQQFFKEIAHKSNILYNVLPDIISRLSDTQLHLVEDKYHTIMKYIISLINKDRQVESLVEKLCLRFRITVEERQWRDIAFCLTQLTFNEKTIKKLIDNVQYFKDKVQVDEVYDCFKQIIHSTNKTVKPELKVLVAEFETKLQECLAVQDGNADGDGVGESSDGRRSGMDMPPPRAAPRLGRKVQPKKKAAAVQRRNAAHSSDSDEDDFQTKRGASITPARQSARKPATKKTRIVDPDTSSSSSSDEEIRPAPSRSNTRKNRK